MICDFTITSYRSCLSKLLRTYKPIEPKNAFKNHNRDKKYLLLRHDVDHSLDNAYHMSKVENSLGINSIYFIRLHSSYNIFSSKSKCLIKNIIKNGHEIGFHYEFLKDEDLNQSYNRIRKEKVFIESHFKIVMDSACAHQTARNSDIVKNFNFSKTNFSNNFYYKNISNSFKYISDANSVWREGCMCTFADFDKNLYVNTHPVFWCGKKIKSHSKIVNALENKNKIETDLLLDVISDLGSPSLNSDVKSASRNNNSIRVDKIWRLLSNKEEHQFRKVKTDKEEVKTLNDMIEIEKIWDYLIKV